MQTERSTPLFISTIFILTAICFHSDKIYAADKNSMSGMLDFNIYPYLSDVDADSVATLNIFSELNHRWSYFSLLNLINSDEESVGEETTQFYTEHNVRWKLRDDSAFDLTLQMNFRSGENNDRHRLGIRWRLNDTKYLKAFLQSLHLTYAINLHAIQFDKEAPHVWQLEHSFKLLLPAISDRLYLAGFIDHTFNQNLPDTLPRNPIVAEIQCGYEFAPNLFITSEYRINQYRRSDVNNLAVGLEYKMLW